MCAPVSANNTCADIPRNGHRERKRKKKKEKKKKSSICFRVRSPFVVVVVVGVLMEEIGENGYFPAVERRETSFFFFAWEGQEPNVVSWFWFFFVNVLERFRFPPRTTYFFFFHLPRFPGGCKCLMPEQRPTWAGSQERERVRREKNFTERHALGI